MHDNEIVLLKSSLFRNGALYVNIRSKHLHVYCIWMYVFVSLSLIKYLGRSILYTNWNENLHIRLCQVLHYFVGFKDRKHVHFCLLFHLNNSAPYDHATYINTNIYKFSHKIWIKKKIRISYLFCESIVIGIFQINI